MMNDDLDGMLKDDLEKFQSMRGNGGMDTTLPALIELAFTALTGLVVIAWFLSLFLLSDSVDGVTLMSLGMLGLVMFGLPAGLIYALRRGGATVIRDMIRGMAG